MVDGPRDDEYNRVELPFIQQLKLMGWTHIEGDTEVHYLTENRPSFRHPLLTDRLSTALKRINVDSQGKPWLDDTKIGKALSDLGRAGIRKLLDANRDVTRLLIKGTEVEGLDGKQKTIHYIDFDNPDNNDFLAVSQFRVDPVWSTGDRGFIIPDIVLFINGIPVVVIECKRPDIEEPLAEAINQLLRYSNQRDSVEEPEGAEQLFRSVQIMVATYFHHARVGTVCSRADRYLEWKDPYPKTIEELAKELGVDNPSSQQILVAGMLHPHNLLDIIRNFTLFKEDDKIIPRYQQYRAVHKTIERLTQGTASHRNERADQRGGVIWHTQGSGKSLTMVFLVRKMRTMPELRRFKVVIITDRKDLEDQIKETAELTDEPLQVAKAIKELREFLKTPGPGLVFGLIQKFREPDQERRYALQLSGVLNESEDILVLVDEAHRSHTSSLHARLVASLPNSARVGFTGTPIMKEGKKATHDIFGPFIDIYTIRQSQADGSTVPILYHGRTTSAEVKDAESLDQLFVDMFEGRSRRELDIIRAKYARTGDVLEAPGLIKAKARDMLAHYIAEIMPNGFKAQVVTVSRLAAARYYDALLEAQKEIVKKLEAFDSKLTELTDEGLEGLDAESKFLARAYPHLQTIRELKFATVISWKHNELPSWRRWSDRGSQKANIKAFKKSLDENKLAFLIVNNMLIVGFDAPVEQVLYLDRSMRDHELLQAIARVNRTRQDKKHGLVVDYYGVANHLKEALDVYAEDDVEGALTPLDDMFPVLEDRRRRVVRLFTNKGCQLKYEDACIELLRDERLRAEFQIRLKEFLQTLDMVLYEPRALEYLSDAKTLRYIHKVASNLYRDENLNLVGVGEKVRALIDKHIAARGVDPKIPPVDILSAGFEAHVTEIKSARAQAAEMEYASRHYIRVHLDEDPVYYKKLSERLEEILRTFKDNWDVLAENLRSFTKEVRAGRPADKTGLNPKTQAPFLSVLTEAGGVKLDSDENISEYAQAIVEMVEHISQEIAHVDFWKSRVSQDELRGWVVMYLDKSNLVPFEQLPVVADMIVQLAKALHSRLVK